MNPWWDEYYGSSPRKLEKSTKDSRGQGFQASSEKLCNSNQFLFLTKFYPFPPTKLGKNQYDRLHILDRERKKRMEAGRNGGNVKKNI